MKMNVFNKSGFPIVLVLLSLLVVLALMGCQSAGGDSTATAQATPDPVLNIVWQWASVTEQSTGNVTSLPNPENYTIIFRSDGTFSGQADCNAISGTYTRDRGYTITLGPGTLAACAEGSLDQQYLNLLSNVAAGGPDGAGGFALESAGGAERMLFQNGGAAPQS